MDLHKSLVRPKPEYANQVWYPRLVKHIDILENVQIWAIKLIPGFDRSKARVKQVQNAGPDRVKAEVRDRLKEYQEDLTKLKLPTLT